MPLPPDIDQEKLVEVALALLWLGAHGNSDNLRAWKAIDWDVMDMLYKRGWIGDPVGKQKSVLLSPEGIEAAKHCFEKHFGVKSEC